MNSNRAVDGYCTIKIHSLPTPQKKKKLKINDPVSASPGTFLGQLPVVPPKAGTHGCAHLLDARLRGHDGTRGNIGFPID